MQGQGNDGFNIQKINSPRQAAVTPMQGQLNQSGAELTDAGPSQLELGWTDPMLMLDPRHVAKYSHLCFRLCWLIILILTHDEFNIQIINSLRQPAVILLQGQPNQFGQANKCGTEPTSARLDRSDTNARPLGMLLNIPTSASDCVGL